MATTVYIAEKQDLAKAIVKGLGDGFTRKDGYFEKGNVKVTWALGHLLEIVKHPNYKGASLDQLPIKDLQYQYAPAKGKEAQVKVVKNLIKEADLIVHSGDIDEEGQIIVDSLLRLFGYNKTVKRLLIADFNDNAVKKSLANLKDNADYEYMGYQAEARSIADLTLGMNLSIAATKVAQNQGYDNLVSMGRVQTAVLGLVVRRDRENKNHVKSYYYTVSGDFSFNNLSFPARLAVDEKTVVKGNPIELDDKGRIASREQADEIVSICTAKSAVIKSAVTKKMFTPPPLPFNLLELQVACSKLFKYSPTKTMEITQALREKHQLITYNRSDCQYLSDEQYGESPLVLNAIKQNSTNLNKMVSEGDKGLKSPAFDSNNITAHTAIIPTQTVKDLNQLSEAERNVYNLIAKYYVAQFYPNYEFDQTKLTVDCEGFVFKTTSNVPTQIGWKVLFGKDELGGDEADDDLESDLRTLSNNASGKCDKATVENKETKPRPLYTEATLLTDLTRASNYIKDKNLAKVLKERDKDKKGEHGGIGTPATRHSIIEKLFERDFITKKGDKIISTEVGQNLYDFAPDNLRYPDLTALWASDFAKIKNQQQVVKFLNFVIDNHIAPEVERFKANRNTLVLGKAQLPQPCPKCKRPMYLKNGQYGKYWSCSGRNDETNPCKFTAKDNKGKPDLTPKEAPVATDFKCEKCDSPLVFKKVPSKKDKTKMVEFYSCTGYPKCKQSYWVKDGKPDFDGAKK